MSLSVTAHFSVGEFASHDGAAYPIGAHDDIDHGSSWLTARLLPLCLLLEAIRTACGGKAIYIVSGYRTQSHNTEIGGAKFSQHCEGRAADIKVEGMTPSDVHRIILDLYASGKIPSLGGIGIYPSWCHCDVRTKSNNHLAQWTGEGIGSEA